ncbi:hypothetical protein CR513_12733, partial [Mucuna pruriens]
MIGRGAITISLVISHYPPLHYLGNPRSERWHMLRSLQLKERQPGIQQKIIPRELKKQDLVLRRVLKDSTTNKLIPNWEGSYKIIEEVGIDQRFPQAKGPKRGDRPTIL